MRELGHIEKGLQGKEASRGVRPLRLLKKTGTISVSHRGTEVKSAFALCSGCDR